MVLKIVVGLVIIVGLFLTYVATRKDSFVFERSGLIKAPPEKIFPYISQFKLGSQWSPYEKGIEMPKSYGGVEGAVGSSMDFGPSRSGAGRLEILELVPNQMVKLSLKMTSPVKADNVVTYRLTPEGPATRFSWKMEGHNNFMGKLITVMINCEKMLGGQMAQGIENLKSFMESAN